MIRDRFGQAIEPSLTPPSYFDDEPDYDQMDDEQRIAEREAQPHAEIARELVEAERRVEWLEAAMRQRGLEVPKW